MFSTNYFKAKYFFYNKKWTNSLIHFEKAFKNNKNISGKDSYQIGFSYSKLKKWKEALFYLRLASEKRPGNYRWQFRYAIALENTNNKKEAESIYQNVFNNILKNSQDYYNAGMLLIGFTRPLIAENFIKRAIELDDNNEVYLISIAELYHKQKKWWQELEILEKYCQLNKTNPLQFYNLGVAYEKMSSYDLAVKAYEKAISLDSGEYEWFYRLGYCHERSGNMELANQNYQIAIKKSSNEDAKKYGVAALHKNKGLWVDTYRALEKLPSNIKKDAKYYYSLGLAYDRSYLWDKANIAYQKALKIKPGDSSYYYRTGFVLERDKKYLLAAKHYEMAARASKNFDKNLFFRLGYAFYLAGLYEKACYAFLMLNDSDNDSISVKSNKYYSSNPWSADEFLQRSHDAELLEDLPMAEKMISSAIERNSKYNSQMYFKLGIIRFKLRMFKEACEAFTESSSFSKPYGVPLDELKTNNRLRHHSSYLEYYDRLKVKDDVILLESFHGASASCNPLAIFNYLHKSKEFMNFKFVWVIAKGVKIPEVLKRKRNVIIIERESDAYLRYLASAKYLINNVSFPNYFIRKNEQQYLNTWHGTPMKYLGKDIKDNFLAHANVARNFLQATHIISQNDYTNNILLERYDVSNISNAVVAATGYPRVDSTLNLSKKNVEELKAKLGAKPGQKVVLYAPTWRGKHGSAQFDTTSLIKDLAAMKTNGALIVFRGHHMIEKLISKLDIPAVIAHESIDTNILLAAVDILITDYSSVAFDFLPLKKPIIYYMYDLEEYKLERGLYIPPEELPGTVCFVREELSKSLAKIISDEHKTGFNAEESIKKFVPYDDGQATRRVIDLFFYGINEKSQLFIPPLRENIFIYAGPFYQNGIATSILNLLNKIDYNRFSVTLAVDVNSIKENEERIMTISKVPAHVQIIGWEGGCIFSPEEKWIQNKFDVQRGYSSDNMSAVLESAYQREFKRITGGRIPKAVIHFEGYNKKWAHVFSSLPTDTCRKIIFQHNDMFSEFKEKYSYLEGVFNLYNKFDKIVSVSEDTKNLNSLQLGEKYLVQLDKFAFADNLQDPVQVESLSCTEFEDSKLFDKNLITFITLGRLSPEKDHEKLINAFYEVYQTHKNIQLIILGDGPLSTNLTSLIDKLKLKSVIHLLGRKNNPFPYLKKSDCFVLSSNHEGQPMVLFEAMILKKPIIATDIVGNRGVLKDKYGMLVDNSVMGLSRGLSNFIGNRPCYEQFDIEQYQSNAINMFYNLIK